MIKFVDLLLWQEGKMTEFSLLLNELLRFVIKEFLKFNYDVMKVIYLSSNIKNLISVSFCSAQKSM